ncbi:DUF4436 family protein [Mycolicibacterium frederiksbergense]|uniref:DUF4436 family protein n=1 Tax=Mycolicibacterium frederiksbergense TaxID=117567 RepID=UPI00265BD607|nr:DUF4436 family protein [Mycolicibacterium frederiksbergense]MDO0977023.1 DUF4436 family protein [Mycolicibacterium frederiksbergense]
MQRAEGRSSRRATVLTSVVLVAVVYVASLIGYSVLEQPPAQFQFPEAAASAETAVIVRLRQVDTSENRLVIDVLVHPGVRSQADPPDRYVIRLSSWTDSGELIYLHDDLVGNEHTTSLVAVGDPDEWPFDSYVTDTIGMQLFAVSGDVQRPIAAPIVVGGGVNGWVIDSRLSTVGSPGATGPAVAFELQRTREALVLIAGILLVLLALPAAALFVAIETVLDRRKLQPPFITWFAAMLFAVVPLRNVLPGAPPAGAWIDLAVVVWVLVALAAAMVLYIIAWWRQTRPE